MLSLESQQYFGVRSGIFSLEDPVIELTDTHKVLKMPRKAKSSKKQSQKQPRRVQAVSDSDSDDDNTIVAVAETPKSRREGLRSSARELDSHTGVHT